MATENIVYALIDPRNGEIRYVGQTVALKKRLVRHKSNARRDARYHVNRWVAQLLAKGLEPRAVILTSLAAANDLSSAERYWIAELRSRGCPLTNLTDGGEGTRGLRRRAASEQTKALLRARRRTQAPPAMGTSHTDETRRAMSRAHGGRPFTDELGRVYLTLADASNALGMSRTEVCSVLRGRRPSAHGHIFQYRTQSFA